MVVATTMQNPLSVQGSKEKKERKKEKGERLKVKDYIGVEIKILIDIFL